MQNRPDHRRRRDQGPRLRRFGLRSPILFGDEIHELEKPGGCHGTNLVVTSRQLASEATKQTALRWIVPVVRAEIGCHDCLKRIVANAMTSCGLSHLSSGLDRFRAGFGNQLVLRVEMPVEPAMGKA